MTGKVMVADGATRASSWAALRQYSARNAMVYALVLIVAAAQISYPQFLTWANVQNMLVQNAGVAVVAIGMTFVLIGGGFDLSVVGTLSLGSVLVAGLCMEVGLAFGPALLLTLAATAVLGALNGLIVTKLGVNAFIATLGTATAFSGGAAMYSDSQPISVTRVPGFETLGAGTVFGLQLQVVVLVVLLVLGGLVLHRSVYGRNLFAVGGNPEAARLAGLPVERVLVVAFVISAVGAGLAGSMMASTLATGQIDQLPNVALDAIAAVVIGGTSLFGGEGAMWRTAVGVLILATLNNLFSSLALDAPMQNVIKGAVLIVAVAFEGLGRRRNW